MKDWMNAMLGKVAPGMCRLSMQGSIAIKTADGYRSYDSSSGRMINCDNFVFPVGEEFFFVIPTNRVKAGDIILAGGKPKYVLEAQKNRITALNYETSVIETILPERYLFLGNTYFYGKIVSMFGSSNFNSGKGPGKVLKYMMFSQILKGQDKTQMLPLLMLAGGGKNGFGFDSLFDLEDSDPEDDANDDPEGDPAD